MTKKTLTLGPTSALDGHVNMSNTSFQSACHKNLSHIPSTTTKIASEADNQWNKVFWEAIHNKNSFFSVDVQLFDETEPVNDETSTKPTMHKKTKKILPLI